MSTTVFKIEQHQNQFDFAGSVLFASEDDALCKKLVSALSTFIAEFLEREQAKDEALQTNLTAHAHGRAAGRPARRVTVVSVIEQPNTPSGISTGDRFDSASDLSRLMGYGYNAVGTALAQAKKFGTETATVRGVTVCYEGNEP